MSSRQPCKYGSVQRAAYANRVPGVPVYRRSTVAGGTVAGTKVWLNPNAFVSVIDPATGACTGGNSPASCQFGASGRNSVRGPHYTDSDIYVTKTFPIHERVTFRLNGELFNAFNHPNFALPREVEAGIPGGSIPARFGTIESTISLSGWAAGRRSRWAQFTARDCISGKDSVLRPALRARSRPG